MWQTSSWRHPFSKQRLWVCQRPYWKAVKLSGNFNNFDVHILASSLSNNCGKMMYTYMIYMVRQKQILIHKIYIPMKMALLFWCIIPIIIRLNRPALNFIMAQELRVTCGKCVITKEVHNLQQTKGVLNITFEQVCFYHHLSNTTEHGPLARYAKLRVRMRRECRERFPRHRR